MTVYIEIEQNPNCDAMDGQVFQPRSAPRAVAQVLAERNGEERWYEVTGLDRDAQVCPASASPIDDSGDGACYLVTGGEWGLRFRDPAAASSWDISDPAQWGAAYLMLPGDGNDLRFL
jgi:hypothetical protein